VRTGQRHVEATTLCAQGSSAEATTLCAQRDAVWEPVFRGRAAHQLWHATPGASRAVLAHHID
jgi:hypothetical protein